jgi:methionine synthase I (cobalamin-dependent)
VNAFFERGRLLFDGAMGTELIRRGALREACLEEMNLSNPELLSAIHAEYRAAGAHVLTTNTFGANRFRLESHGLQARMLPINVAATGLARAECGDGLVAGSVGPSGLRPLPDSEALQAAFREQAEVLDPEVDLFVCETFGDLEELRAAVLGIAAVSSRPIVALMAYRIDGRTPLGLTPSEVVQGLQDLPVWAIGVNCAVGLDTAERVAHELVTISDRPIVVQPNAGEPVISEGSISYPVDPESFALLAGRLSGVAAGFGGCCGTTPAHIAAARKAFLEA